jgi:5-methylcytosine-specific restriction endonuclease McrA
MTQIPADIRRLVEQRARGWCEYCQAPLLIVMVNEVDHIIPTAKGGTTTEDNLCHTCRICNGAKSDFATGIDAQTNQELLLFNPRTQKWADHFSWSNNFLTIQPQTPTGRATVARLNLNSRRFRMARTAWRVAGWQPPS